MTTLTLGRMVLLMSPYPRKKENPKSFQKIKEVTAIGRTFVDELQKDGGDE